MSRVEQSPIPTLQPDHIVGSCRLYLGLAPIVVIDMGNTDRPSVVELLARFDEQVIARRRPFVTVTDCRRMSAVPSADVRRGIADWMKKNENEGSGIGAVTILDSAIVRGALTAVYWMVQPSVPQGTAATWAEAHRWALARLDDAKVPVPPFVRDAVEQQY